MPVGQIVFSSPLPGVKTGVKGDQGAAGPSFPLYELPETRGGRPCAPVLPHRR